MVSVKQFGGPNVGDAVGSRIIENVLGCAVRTIGEEPAGTAHVIGIGSIAHWSDKDSFLWGCGLIDQYVALQHAPAAVLAVRGYRTRDILHARGIQCSEVIGDPGLLLPELIPAEKSPRFDLGIIPHYVDLDSAFVDACRRQGILVISPLLPAQEYVEMLVSCNRILTSSLHGIVFAHAYGVDAVWVTISDRVHGNGFKFADYYSSLGVLSKEFPTLRPSDATIDRMAASCWQPSRLPDRAALRGALVAHKSVLDRDLEEAVA